MHIVMLPVLAAGMAALIAYLSLVPGDSKTVRWMPPWLQNAGHVGCYAVLGLLFFLALAPALDSRAAQSAIAFVLATGFGVTMEWLQGRSPGRHTSLFDAVQNALGASIGIYLATALQ